MCDHPDTTHQSPATTAPTVSIRGASSVGGSSPLVIVDGVVVGSSDMNDGDVESVKVIKAASASTIYGTMVLCPPIVITTGRTPSAPQSRPAIREKESGVAAFGGVAAALGWRNTTTDNSNSNKTGWAGLTG